MSDYISRQAAIEAIANEVEPFVIVEPGTTCVIGAGVKEADVFFKLESLPSADVVEVVRCDDCRYYGSRRWCELHSSVFDDNAFCSYGEKREDSNG